MAQKNINIVYNVDTQSIQVAKQQVDQAKAATDALSQSAKNLGDQGAAGSQKFANTIDGLRTQMQQLKTIIENTSQSDTNLLNQRIAQYKEMQVQLDKFNQGLKETQSQVQNTGNSFNGLYNTIRTVITAGLVKEMITVNLEMAKLSGQVEGVARGFQKNIPGASLLLAELRSKTHGVLTDFELMQRTLLAKNLGVGIEELGTIMEFVQTRVQQTGQNFDILLDKFIRGIGVKSPRLLDDLGISSVRLKENLDGVALSTISIGDFTQKVVKIAEEELGKMGGYVETSATKVDQLSVAWEKLKITASQTFSSSGFVDLLNKVVDGFTLMLKSNKEINEEFNKNIAVNQAREFLTAQNNNIEAIDKEIDRIEKEMQARGALKATIKEQYEALKPLNHADDERRAFMQEQYKTLAQQNDISQKEIMLLKQRQEQIKNQKPDEEQQIGIIERLDQEIKKLNKDLSEATSFSAIDKIKDRLKELDIFKKAILSTPGTPETEDQRAAREQKAMDEIAAIDNKANDEMLKNETEYDKKLIKEGEDYFGDYIALKQAQRKEDMAIATESYREKERAERDHQETMHRFYSRAARMISSEARQIADQMIENEVNKYDTMLQANRDFYEGQISLAGTNQKAVAKLQKQEQARERQLEKEKKNAQKKAAIAKIEIDTATNIIRSIADLGVPWGLALGAIAAAMGVYQISQVQKYAKGVIDLQGPGSETSDSIPSMLSRGESVMTAEETRNSGNILRGIRSKKLNDQVLEKLTITTDGIIFKPDNSDVVNAIDRNKSPDYARQFSVLYETKETRKGLKRIIRSKSFND